MMHTWAFFFGKMPGALDFKNLHFLPSTGASDLKQKKHGAPDLKVKKPWSFCFILGLKVCSSGPHFAKQYIKCDPKLWELSS